MTVRYSDIVTTEVDGLNVVPVPIVGASVIITDSTGVIATLTQDDGTEIVQPVFTDGRGMLEFNVPSPGDVYRFQYRYGGRLIRETDIIIGTPPQFKGADGKDGDPGGNVMAVGGFSALSGLNIPAGTTLLQTSGMTRGVLIEDTSLTDANVAAYPLAIVKTANGRYFRRDYRAGLWAEQFGAVGDGLDASADGNNAAIDAILAYAAFCGRTDSYRLCCPPIYFGIGDFVVTKGFNLKAHYQFIGMASGYAGGEVATIITLKANAYLFVVNTYDTNNGLPILSPGVNDRGADGTEFSHLYLRYAGTETIAANGRLNGPTGVWAHAAVYIHDCIFTGFTGCGWRIDADVGATDINRGQASCSVIERVWALYNYYGAYIIGGDANVCEVTSCTFGNNYAWGLWANHFLCNTYINNHFRTNGYALQVDHNNKTWALMPNREGVSGTTEPGSDPTVWNYVSDYTTSYHTQWVSGGNYLSSGDVAHLNLNAQSAFLGNYVEGGIGAVLMYPAISMGGEFKIALGATGIHLSNNSGNLVVQRAILQYASGLNAINLDPNIGINSYSQVANSTFGIALDGAGANAGWAMKMGAVPSLYIAGPSAANPGYATMDKYKVGRSYASNAAAVAAGMPTGTIYYWPDGTVHAVV